jgi:hypothetical protein
VPTEVVKLDTKQLVEDSVLQFDEDEGNYLKQETTLKMIRQKTMERKVSVVNPRVTGLKPPP